MAQSADVRLVDKRSFKFEIVGQHSDILSKAVQRQWSYLCPGKVEDDGITLRRKSKDNYLHSLQINVKQAQSDLTLDSDESQTLNVAAVSASLEANTIWGALRGMETFSQLVYQDKQYSPQQIKQTHIEDFPRFKHRGFMIDTARHYYPLKIIMKHIDAMSQGKLNVLHWHIVDDQSFPFQSLKFPQMNQNGAWTHQSKHTQSQYDIKFIWEETK